MTDSIRRRAAVDAGVPRGDVSQTKLNSAVMIQRHRGSSAGSQANAIAMPIKSDDYHGKGS